MWVKLIVNPPQISNLKLDRVTLILLYEIDVGNYFVVWHFYAWTNFQGVGQNPLWRLNGAPGVWGLGQTNPYTNSLEARV